LTAQASSAALRGPAIASAPGRRLLIFTDAWAPQVNGVVRTLEKLGQDMESLGWTVAYATPLGHATLPLPTYPEIRLALFPRNRLERILGEFAPDAIHIATEGTIGMSARAVCRARGLAFTTSFHTRFPEYIHARFPFVSTEAVYRFLRWFHAPATAIMVATPSLKEELEANGFRNLRIWTRGVDIDHFRPIPDASMPFPRPIWLYVGRVAVEKNVEAFLKLDLPGTKVVIGEGPARAALARAYPAARFLGPKSGEDLVRITPQATFSFSRVSPTRSGWSCWKRWLAACRLRRFRFRGLAMCSAKRRRRPSTTIFVLPASAHSKSRGQTLVLLR